jgi:hypothetical protein
MPRTALLLKASAGRRIAIDEEGVLSTE